MESLAYLHLAEAYEDPNLATRELVIFKALDWQKINSRWIQIVSLLLAISLLSFANAALALQKGDRGPDVVTLQNALKREGVFPPNVRSTGNYERITEEAVKKFQRAYGLTVDGIAGPQTLSALYNNNVFTPDPLIPAIPAFTQYPELRPGTRGSEVTKLQEALREQGYYPQYLSVNGYYDFSTEDAVRNYQDGIGLTPSGIADRYTLALLYGRNNQSASAPIPELVVNSGTSTGSGFPNSVPVAGVGYIEQQPVFTNFDGQGGQSYCRRVETNGGRLNRRSQPTDASPIIGKILNGDTVEILNTGSNGWVPLQDGGYVSAEYLKQCF